MPNPRSAGEALQEIKRLDKIESYIKLLDKPSFTYTIRGQDKTFSIDKDDAGTIVKSGVSSDDDLALLNTEFFNWIDQDSQLRKLLSNLFLPTAMRRSPLRRRSCSTIWVRTATSSIRLPGCPPANAS